MLIFAKSIERYSQQQNLQTKPLLSNRQSSTIDHRPYSLRKQYLGRRVGEIYVNEAKYAHNLTKNQIELFALLTNLQWPPPIPP